jgi:hypothetical protein
MNEFERRVLAELFREDDRLRAEHEQWEARREAEAAPPVEKSGAEVVLYREHENIAPAVSVMARRAADADDDDDIHLFADPELDRTFAETIGHVICGLRNEWRDEVRDHIKTERDGHERAVAELHAENVELKGLLRETLSRFAEINDAARGLASEVAILKADKRDRAVRDQTIVERSGRIAQLQKENAEAHAQLSREKWNQEFAARDARIDRLQARLDALVTFLSGSFPRGFDVG